MHFLRRSALRSHVIYQLYEDLLGQPHADLTPAALNNARPRLYSAMNKFRQTAG